MRDFLLRNRVIMLLEILMRSKKISPPVTPKWESRLHLLRRRPQRPRQIRGQAARCRILLFPNHLCGKGKLIATEEGKQETVGKKSDGGEVLAG